LLETRRRIEDKKVKDKEVQANPGVKGIKARIEIKATLFFRV
jgi:hypothetical protein